MDWKEFEKLVKFLCASVGKVPGPYQAEVYFELLGDLPPDVLRAACQQAVCENELDVPPPVAAIRRVATLLQYGEPLGWVEAWDLLLQSSTAMRSKKRRPEIPPLVLLASQEIGWSVAYALENDMAGLRASFRDAYMNLADQYLAWMALPPCVKVLRAEIELARRRAATFPNLTKKERA